MMLKQPWKVLNMLKNFILTLMEKKKLKGLNKIRLGLGEIIQETNMRMMMNPKSGGNL